VKISRQLSAQEYGMMEFDVMDGNVYLAEVNGPAADFSCWSALLKVEAGR
jgi:hypothetical protein